MVKDTLNAILKGGRKLVYESSSDEEAEEEEPLHVDKKTKNKDYFSSDSEAERQFINPTLKSTNQSGKKQTTSTNPKVGTKRRIDKLSDETGDKIEPAKGTYIGVNNFMPATKEFRVINRFPKEAKRVNYVSELANEEGIDIDDGAYVCSFCQVGDGDENGMSPDGLKKVYAFENKYMYKMSREQFINNVVEKFNTLVVGENLIRNPTDKIPLLTVTIYANHLEKCIGPWDPLYRLWKRVETWEEESDIIRCSGAKFRREDGVVLKDIGTYKMLIDIEKEIHKYLKTAEVITLKRTELIEAKNMATRMTKKTRGQDVFRK